MSIKEKLQKLDIPEPSGDLESRIIAEAKLAENKSLFPRLAVIAACLLVIFAVFDSNQFDQTSPQDQFMVQGYDILMDVEFYDEDELFEDIAYPI